MSAFDDHTLELLHRTKEVRLETSRGPDAPVHSVIIWVVVADGRVLIRSYRGASARWYREVRANPSTTIRVNDRRIPARAAPANDPLSIEQLNAGLRAKYRASGSLNAMLVDEILDTTLELLPEG